MAFGGLRRPQPLPAEGVAANGRSRESVWDYPRPPSLEPLDRRVRVELGGETIAASEDALRVCETSHPPSVYVPPSDIVAGVLKPAGGGSFCEWKGAASYFDARAAGRLVSGGAWAYPNPSERFADLADHVAFYPALFDCFLDDEAVMPQPGSFYGGWVTAEIVGPVKGEPGSGGW